MAETKEDLLRQVSDHLVKVHGVKTPSQTIMSYIEKQSR
ncbi:MAG: DUF1059 domain-containing protein [Actinomycetota bacterium]|nr:DUF1059 domain-containing protein [Actinomycetota bacterium]